MDDADMQGRPSWRRRRPSGQLDPRLRELVAALGNAEPIDSGDPQAETPGQDAENELLAIVVSGQLSRRALKYLFALLPQATVDRFAVANEVAFQVVFGFDAPAGPAQRRKVVEIRQQRSFSAARVQWLKRCGVFILTDRGAKLEPSRLQQAV